MAIACFVLLQIKFMETLKHLTWFDKCALITWYFSCFFLDIYFRTRLNFSFLLVTCDYDAVVLSTSWLSALYNLFELLNILCTIMIEFDLIILFFNRTSGFGLA